MKSTACICAVLLLACSGTVAAKNTAPSNKVFLADEKGVPDAETEVGGVRIEVRNTIPAIEVPAPHLPTVVHLNAQLCSVAPNQYKSMSVDDSGNIHFIDYAGEKRCLALSPSIFYETSARFLISSQQVAQLINEEYTTLELQFVSSTQTTSYAFPCRPHELGRISPLPEARNLLRVEVNGQHSLSFQCKESSADSAGNI